MDLRKITPEQIRRAGMDALVQALGPVGMPLFLQQFDPGQGDYSSERRAWLDQVSLETAVTEIEERRGRI